MSPRFTHSIRFALPTLAAVLLAGLGYELFATFVRQAVPDGVAAGAALGANLRTWALIAAVMGAVTFLLHLSDAITRAPEWRFAWLSAAWSAMGAVAVVFLLEAGRPGAAIGTAVTLAILWHANHRYMRGWPGRAPEEAAAAARPRGPAGGRDLP